MGLHAYAEKNGMKIECSNVGDRYVLEMMLKKGYILGGEQSGHVIFLEYASTGDGELTALQFMSILKESGRKCSEIAAEVVPWPQVMINVKVPNDQKATLQEKPEIKADIEAAAAELGDNGRILVRPSGTEALVRVMVEGKDSAQVDTLAKGLPKRLSLSYNRDKNQWGGCGFASTSFVTDGGIFPSAKYSHVAVRLPDARQYTNREVRAV